MGFGETRGGDDRSSTHDPGERSALSALLSADENPDLGASRGRPRDPRGYMPLMVPTMAIVILWAVS
jgi:hypothetical protein